MASTQSCLYCCQVPAYPIFLRPSEETTLPGIGSRIHIGQERNLESGCGIRHRQRVRWLNADRWIDGPATEIVESPIVWTQALENGSAAFCSTILRVGDVGKRGLGRGEQFRGFFLNAIGLTLWNASTKSGSKTEEALALTVWGFFLCVLPGSSVRLGLVLQHIKEDQGLL